MSEKKSLVLPAVVVAALLAAGAIFVLRSPNTGGGGGGGSGETKKSPDAATIDDTITDDDERADYVSKSIEIANLIIGPDYVPGDDAGTVGGLLRVSGTVKNNGTRAVRKVVLSIFPQDKTDQVIGTYLQDVLDNQRLGPGESRPFKFPIPKNPEFSGHFRHTVR